MMTKVAIIGGNGQVGWDLQRSLAVIGEVVSLNRTSKYFQLDLSQPDTIVSGLQEFKPHIIVNASAYTAVDKAEEEQVLAKKINEDAPIVLAEQANKLNALLVHYSTDYVFNGLSCLPYTENDLTEPLNIYGKTKLAGDQAIESIANNYLIFRTSWVYTNRANNFLLTMLKLAEQRNDLSIIDDQIGSPTWSRLIADVTAKAVFSKFVLNNDIKSGLYNLSSSGETSWFGFAKKIFQYTGVNNVKIVAIPTRDYPTPAARPKYTVLSNDKIEKTFKLYMPDWQESLKLCIAELNS